jgi:predicted nucleotidyltransferase
MKQGNYDKILNVFFDNPNGKFYIREIARITKLNPNTILNITNELEKEGVVKREKKKHIVELSAVLDDKFKTLKKIDNLKKVYDSGIIDFLKGEFSPGAIVIIGSYSIGEDVMDSDVDIVILTKKDYKDVDLTGFEEKLNRKIHLIITDYNKISEEFYINLINGIVLYGAINKK